MHAAEPNGHNLVHHALAGPRILFWGRLENPRYAVFVLWYLLAEESKFTFADALFRDGEKDIEYLALRGKTAGHDLADDTAGNVSTSLTLLQVHICCEGLAPWTVVYLRYHESR